MPNMRGTSPVSRGEGGRSYVARTVSEVSSRGKAVAARTKAQKKCVEVARAGKHGRHGPDVCRGGRKVTCNPK